MTDKELRRIAVDIAVFMPLADTTSGRTEFAIMKLREAIEAENRACEKIAEDFENWCECRAGKQIASEIAARRKP